MSDGPLPYSLLASALAGLAVGCVADAGTARVPPAAEPETTAAALRVPPPHSWSGSGCTSGGCHDRIEPIRALDSGMMRAIIERGQEVEEPDGCTVCHGGNPGAAGKAEAHRGAGEALSAMGGPDEFFSDPGSPWVNARSCGQCHAELVRAQWNSLMMTEAGKIQGTTWSFGSLEGYEHKWGNYDARNPSDPAARLGTDAYRRYMEDKRAAHPNVWVAQQSTLPGAPAEQQLDDLREHPEQAVFTYIRTECQRCHLGVKGRQRRGDYRGMGCSACHIPYSNEGRYEGRDKTIDKQKPGHLLVHSIQATRDSVVVLHGEAYAGIPVETCTTCHNRGKRIGVSYQGLMESAFDSPYTEGGGGQIGLHTKHYLAMSKDVHYSKGMLCQDCHTSSDVHGDGFLAGANLAAVEIECADCHGTPSNYPWELPLGYGDEDVPGPKQGPPRGVAADLPRHLRRGKAWPARDGYILTARGNPMPEVVRVGDRVLLHTAGGRDLWLEPLKRKVRAGTLPPNAQTAMVSVSKHVQTMECYACHTSWAPQCYGCHVKIDYSAGKQSFDWVAAGHEHRKPEHRATRGESTFDTLVPGQVRELRSYMRWENPALGVNGEGRVSPLIPGCQVSATIVGADGKEIVRNHIFRTLPGSEGSAAGGQLGSDMSPVHPHTVGKARSCESCHASAKAMGYGIGGSELNAPWSEPTIVDLTTADGRVIPKNARVQIEAVAGLDRDWSAVVTPEGKQLQTVGHHFKGSGPLTAQQRRNMDRRNVCVACHATIPDGSLAISVLHHLAEMANQLPEDNPQHTALVEKVLLTAGWAQVGGAAAMLLGLLFGIAFWRRQRARRR